MTNKGLIYILSHINSRITINTNIETTNSLDITLDVAHEKFKPYRKPNHPLYVHKESNHPSTVIKQLPISINKSLSEIS